MQLLVYRWPRGDHLPSFDPCSKKGEPDCLFLNVALLFMAASILLLQLTRSGVRSFACVPSAAAYGPQEPAHANLIKELSTFNSPSPTSSLSNACPADSFFGGRPLDFIPELETSLSKTSFEGLASLCTFTFVDGRCFRTPRGRVLW